MASSKGTALQPKCSLTRHLRERCRSRRSSSGAPQRSSNAASTPPPRDTPARRACTAAMNWTPTGRSCISQSSRQAQGRSAVQRRRQRREVCLVHRHGIIRCVPRSGRPRWAWSARSAHRPARYAASKSRRIKRAHLLRLPVVGVVVASRQCIGAKHDASLDLSTETLGPGHCHDLLDAVLAVVADPQCRNACRRIERGCSSTRWER